MSSNEHTHYARLQKGHQRQRFMVKKVGRKEAYLLCQPATEDRPDLAPQTAIEQFNREVISRITDGWGGVVVIGKRALAEYDAL